MTFSADRLPVEIACVHPLDPEILEAGLAELARSARAREPGDSLTAHWSWHLAHLSAFELSPAAREALFAAGDALQALRVAETALEVAGTLLVRALEADPG